MNLIKGKREREIEDRLNINTERTQYTKIGLKNEEKLETDNEEINKVNQFKNLGLILESDIKFVLKKLTSKKT